MITGCNFTFSPVEFYFSFVSICSSIILTLRPRINEKNNSYILCINYFKVNHKVFLFNLAYLMK